MNKTLIAAAIALAGLAACASTTPAARQTAAVAGTVALRAGFLPDPYRVTVTAGGTVAASTRSSGCAGFIAGTPDFVLTYTAVHATADLLHVYVRAAADTTLVVRSPRGSWVCNDDDEFDDGVDPWVSFIYPETGTYSIWVGTYARGSYPAATLYISEIDS